MELDRRSFLGAWGVAAMGSRLIWPASPLRAGRPGRPGPMSSCWRQAFPALGQQVNGQPLAYLDSAATTLRPRAVIDAVSHFYESDNANPAAALHTLARRAAEQYGAARATVARFLNASAASEVVFTKGTTEAINLVASTWGAANITRGDEIVLSIAEHYSNLLPWRAVAERAGARVIVVDVDDQGRLSPERVAAAIHRPHQAARLQPRLQRARPGRPRPRSCAASPGPGTSRCWSTRRSRRRIAGSTCRHSAATSSPVPATSCSDRWAPACCGRSNPRSTRCRPTSWAATWRTRSTPPPRSSSTAPSNTRPAPRTSPGRWAWRRRSTP